MLFQKMNKLSPVPWSKLVAGALLIILFFGLRPKGLRFQNPVRLYPEKGAIHFQKNGMAFVAGVFAGQQDRLKDAFTIELAAKADGVPKKKGFGALLMIHDGEDLGQLFVGQYGVSLVAMNGDDFDHTRRFPRVVAKDVFEDRALHLITITAGGGSTRVYVDGALSMARDTWQLKIPLAGEMRRMVVGNSVYGNHGWTGEIHGVAVYGGSFTPEEVKRRFDEWTAKGRFPYEEKIGPLVFYGFTELQGGRVVDRSGRNPSLEIPSRPTVLKKKVLFLAPGDIKPDGAFFSDVALNFIGFIPLGAALCGWVGSRRRWSGRSAVVAAVCCCFMVSLSIEVLQAWIPTRSSSLLDLFLNTAGAWAGAEAAIRCFRGERGRQPQSG